jgi:hypothetical protein
MSMEISPLSIVFLNLFLQKCIVFLVEVRPQFLNSQNTVRMKNAMRWSEGTLLQKY